MKRVIFFLFASSSILQAQTYDVLFLGNSYTYANNLPLMISEIALSFGDTVNYDSNTPGGCTLQGHTINSTSLSKISQQSWDFVVIQAQSQEPSFPPSQVATQTYPYAQILVDSIAANDSCTEPVFFMTWGRKNGDANNASFYPILGTYLGMQWRLRQSYLEMGLTHNATVAPVGMSWKKSIHTNPSFELYLPDESHPNIAGSYLAACTFYCTLFNKSCVGSSYYPSSLSASDAAYLQDLASTTVLDSTATWNMFDIQNIDAFGDITFDFSAETSNADGYFWDFGDGNESTDQNPKYTYSNFGIAYNVFLTVFSNDGCRSLTEEITINTTFPEHVAELDGIKVYPNPVQDILNVELIDSKNILFYSILGELLDYCKNCSKLQINMSFIAKGLYVLKIGDQQIKIVK